MIECLVENRGTGAMTAILRLLASFPTNRRFWAIVDPTRECYLPALSGWGIDKNCVLLLRPNTIQELSWTIEQCLRSTALAATCAWLDHRFPARVHRRWQLAAEIGGGIGLLFRPGSAQREPTWADIRLRATPSTQGNPATRRLNIELLYRRGGLGCGSQVWEIDHAQGHVHLVP
jgi:protein ImuA